jgi:hypothetical protein
MMLALAILSSNMNAAGSDSDNVTYIPVPMCALYSNLSSTTDAEWYPLISSDLVQSGHTATVVEVDGGDLPSLVVYGGVDVAYDGLVTPSDMKTWVYSLSSDGWYARNQSDRGIGPRYKHAAFKVNSQLFIHAGFNGSVVSDMWVNNMSSSGGWSAVVNMTEQPPARYGHTTIHLNQGPGMQNKGSLVATFGGRLTAEVAPGAFFGDTFIGNLTSTVIEVHALSTNGHNATNGSNHSAQLNGTNSSSLQVSVQATWAEVVASGSSGDDGHASPGGRAFHTLIPLSTNDGITLPTGVSLPPDGRRCALLFGGQAIDPVLAWRQIPLGDLWELCPPEYAGGTLASAGQQAQQGARLSMGIGGYWWHQLHDSDGYEYGDTSGRKVGWSPMSRYGHAAVELLPGRMVVYGGSSKFPNEFMHDAYEYNRRLQRWRQLGIKGMTAGRRHHTIGAMLRTAAFTASSVDASGTAITIAVAPGEELVLHGGEDGATKTTVGTVYGTNYRTPRCPRGSQEVTCNVILVAEDLDEANATRIYDGSEYTYTYAASDTVVRSLSSTSALTSDASDTSSLVCAPCPPGRASDDGLACGLCPAGRYTRPILPNALEIAQAAHAIGAGVAYPSSVHPGANVNCTLCERGRYSALIGGTSASVCAACPPHHYGTPGSEGAVTVDEACVPCPAGKDNVLNATSCSDCAPGWYSAGSAKVCQQCPGGYHSTGGSVACTGCAAGRYSSAGSAIGCGSCGGGFASMANASECTACSIGYYQPLTAGAGYEGNPTNQQWLDAVCTICAAGRYGPWAGAESCDACSVGKYRGESASPPQSEAACINCPGGKYGTARGADACTDCGKGKYSAATSALSCIDCAVGLFSTGVGQTTANTCALCDRGGTTTISGAGSKAACEGCAAGQVKRKRDPHRYTLAHTLTSPPYSHPVYQAIEWRVCSMPCRTLYHICNGP